MKFRIGSLAATALALLAALAPDAHAERLAYYRGGGGVSFPQNNEVSWIALETGWAASLGMSVPFAHRLAATLDLAHQQFGDSGPATWSGAIVEKDDTAVNSALLGVELVTRRGSDVRPLLSAALGVAQVASGETRTNFIDGRSYTVSGSVETVFALALGAGLRWRLPAHHTAVRVQAQWMYLAPSGAEDGTTLDTGPFANFPRTGTTVPLTIQLEF
jgi:hypothetical protein